MQEFTTEKLTIFRKIHRNFGAQLALWKGIIRPEGSMNKYLIEGLVVGGLFTAAITWIAASDTLAEGGFALLASVVFGLAAGLCIGGLVAANFAMLGAEQKQVKEASATRPVTAHAHA
jgi:hypothetical protein